MSALGLASLLRAAAVAAVVARQAQKPYNRHWLLW